MTDAELDKINGITGKPEGLTPEQSQRWDDVQHDEHLLKTEGPMAKGFRLFGKTLFHGKPGPLKAKSST